MGDKRAGGGQDREKQIGLNEGRGEGQKWGFWKRVGIYELGKEGGEKPCFFFEEGNKTGGRRGISALGRFLF